MLTIRDEQMIVFRRMALAEYIATVRQQLRLDFADEIAHLTDEQLTEFIWAATDEANRFGIELQPDTARFVEYALCFGLDFARGSAWPGASSILHDPALDGRAKIERLDQLAGAPLRF